ncbi:FG-GAP-like repeat-containing protein [Pseudoduganella sp. OTU4001]|uniref:FG-GAP-like repeat-containing protein n=1 Tax=Pseudoduganella sp. OTU4001 TaxID=3043854 RepID=UPI00313B255D
MGIVKAALMLFIAAVLAACGGGGGGTSSNPSNNTGGTPVPAKALEVTLSNIPDGAKAVATSARLTISFNAPLGANGLGASNVQLSDGVNNVPFSSEIAGQAITITPAARLRYKTEYRLTIKAGASAADGSMLKSDYILKFKTVMAEYESKELVPVDRTVYGNNLPRIVIASINSDARPDLVELAALGRSDLPAANGYRLNIYLQNASGGMDKFQTLELIADQTGYAKYVNNLIALDIDGDSKPELLVPEYRAGEGDTQSGIRIFKAGADGKYVASAFVATKYTQTLMAVDIDGDGKTDLIGSSPDAVDQVTGGFQVLRGGAQGFTALSPVPMAAGNYEIASADFDQDGKRELIVNRVFAKPATGPLTSELLIFSQGAAAAFTLNSALTNETAGFCSNININYCRSMKVADINRDGKPELVFAGMLADGSNTEQYTLAFNRRAGGGLDKVFQASLGHDALVFSVQDVDGDKVPDLFVVGNAMFAIVSVGPNFALEFSHQLRMPMFETLYPPNIAVGDMDGDGMPDIIFDSYNYGIVMSRNLKN